MIFQAWKELAKLLLDSFGNVGHTGNIGLSAALAWQHVVMMVPAGGARAQQ